MTPSWYDVLDVDASASTEEIRGAWKGAIADLDPTDRRFRLLNQAAKALLDPATRSAHDAALAADAAEQDEAERGAAERSAAEQGAAGTRPVAARAGGRASAPAAGGVVTLDKPATRVAQAAPASSSGLASASRSWWQPPAWLIAGVAVLVIALAVLAGLELRKPSDTAVAADTRGAQTAAERAATTVLSYDYRELDADEKASGAYLTPSYRADFEKLFALIKDNAEAVKPVVSTQVIASGIQRVDTAGDRVSVLVFVNRPTINAKVTTPKVYQDQVLMKMQKVDGEWLVDDMVTSPAAQ